METRLRFHFFPQNTQRCLMPPINVSHSPPSSHLNYTGSDYAFQSPDSLEELGRITRCPGELALCLDSMTRQLHPQQVPRGGRGRVSAVYCSWICFIASPTVPWLPLQDLQYYKEFSITKKGAVPFSTLLCLQPCQKW